MLSQTGPPQLLDAVVRRGWIGAGTARAVRVAGVPLLVLAALVWLVLTVLRAGGSGPPLAYAEFVDSSSSSYLDVQLERGTTSYGTFSAVVPGQGRVWPAGRVEATQADGGVVELRYEGVGYQDPHAQPGGPPVEPQKPPEPTPSPRKVPLRLVGHVDPTRHVASVDVVVNGAAHHIASSGPVNGAKGVVDDFLGALVAHDWDQLYGIETASMRTGIMRNDFPTAMADIGAVTCIRGAEAIGSTTLVTSPAGVSYARTPIRLSYGRCAANATATATLVLVVDGGRWKAQSME